MSTKVKGKEPSHWEKVRDTDCPRCGALPGEPCTLVYFKHLEARPDELQRHQMKSHHRERNWKMVGAL